MKKYVQVFLAAAVLHGCTLSLMAKENRPWYDAKGWFETTNKIEPVLFDKVYPTPFYEEKWFKWSTIALVSFAAATVTVITSGATAVPGASYVGSVVGGLMGTTWTGGLAALGGGSLAAGGLGMAGGAVVVGTMTDLSLAVALESVTPEEHMQGYRYNILKVPLPQWDRGSEKVLDRMKKVQALQDEFQDGELAESKYRKQINENLDQALQFIQNSPSKYDLINGSVIAYDIGQFDLAIDYLQRAKRLFPENSSFLFYLQTIFYLLNGRLNEALEAVDKSIKNESDALQPYLLKITILMDQQQYAQALKVAQAGLDNYDDDNFQLNYLAGLNAKRIHEYEKGIDYFKEALANTTMNPVEAECKIQIAAIYKQMGQLEEAEEWRDDALSEIDADEYRIYRSSIIEVYRR